MSSNRTHFIGNAQETPGTATAPATLRTDPNDVGDDTTGIAITADGVDPLMEMLDRDGTTPVCHVFETYVAVYKRKLGSSYSVFQAPSCLNGQLAQIPIELGSGARIYAGTGDPNSTFTGTGRVGDVYWRIDTPSTANQRWYVNNGAGTPGTWTGIA